MKVYEVAWTEELKELCECCKTGVGFTHLPVDKKQIFLTARDALNHELYLYERQQDKTEKYTYTHINVYESEDFKFIYNSGVYLTEVSVKE